MGEDHRLGGPGRGRRLHPGHDRRRRALKPRCWSWWWDRAGPARTACWTRRARRWRTTRVIVSFAARSPAPRHFALRWRAHGLDYGIPEDIEDDLARGRIVIANVSRAVIADAAARFPVRVIAVTAPAAILAARLAGRGRETEADIAARLARDVR